MYPYASSFEQAAEKLEYDMYYLPANALLCSVLIPVIIYFLERVREKRINWAMAGGPGRQCLSEQNSLDNLDSKKVTQQKRLGIMAMAGGYPQTVFLAGRASYFPFVLDQLPGQGYTVQRGTSILCDLMDAPSITKDGTLCRTYEHGAH